MTGGGWLDRLAVAAARENGVHGGRERGVPTDEGLSREAAVRLGFAGLASLSLGLWHAAPGSADDPGLTPEASKCFAGCARNWTKTAKENQALCEDVIGRTLDEGKDGWAKLRIALPFPGVALAKVALKGYCYGFADQQARRAWRNCNDKCADECGKARNPQNSSAAREACKPAPPSPPYTPAPPPAPSPTKDPCAACIAVGGVICPPFCPDACNCSGLTGPNACDYVKGFQCP